MRTEQVTKYYCEYCGRQFYDQALARNCQQACHKKVTKRQDWYATHPPKFNPGDILYVLSGLTLRCMSVGRAVTTIEPVWQYKCSEIITDRQVFMYEHQLNFLMSAKQYAGVCSSLSSVKDQLQRNTKVYKDTKSQVDLIVQQDSNTPTPMLRVLLNIPVTMDDLMAFCNSKTK